MIRVCLNNCITVNDVRTSRCGAHLLKAASQPEVYGKVVNYRNEVADETRPHCSRDCEFYNKYLYLN